MIGKLVLMLLFGTFLLLAFGQNALAGTAEGPGFFDSEKEAVLIESDDSFFFERRPFFRRPFVRRPFFDDDDFFFRERDDDDFFDDRKRFFGERKRFFGDRKRFFGDRKDH